MKKQTFLVTAVMSIAALGAVGCESGGTAGGSGGSSGNNDAGGGGGNAATCPASPMSYVSEFKAATGVEPREMRMGGWYIYFDQDGDPAHPNNEVGKLDPRKSSSGPPIDGTTGGPCTGAGSFRQKATGVTGWGVGMGTNIAPAVMGKHGTWDATAFGYVGLRLYAKCAAPTSHVAVKIPSATTDFDVPAPTCTSYSNCVAHGIWDQAVGTSWQLLEVPFATARQDPGAPMGSYSMVANLDPTKLTAIQIQVNANYGDGGAMPNDFECWFDDVHFYK